jgi:hypothetical protein
MTEQERKPAEECGECGIEYNATGQRYMLSGTGTGYAPAVYICRRCWIEDVERFERESEDEDDDD